MELKIKPPAQAKSFIRQLDFLPDKIVLHADTDIVLAYAEISLNLVLHLGLQTSVKQNPVHHRGNLNNTDEITTYPYVTYITFEFITADFTYQVDHVYRQEDVFKLIDYKFPFAKFTYRFEYEKDDILFKQFSENISAALEDHLTYGLHEEITCPHVRQTGLSVGTVSYAGIKTVSSEQENKTSFFILGVYLAILLVGIGFIAVVMGYLLPQWENDIVHWFFAILCLGICGLCIWFFRKIYHAHKIHLKLTQLKTKNKK